MSTTASSPSAVHSKPITFTREQQSEITRLTIWTAQLLLSNGAESRVIEQVTTRLGHALGCSNVQLALTSNAITLSTIINDRCITSVRQVHHAVINMELVTQVLRIVLLAERQRIQMKEVRARLTALHAPHYNAWLIVLMVALSCASFAKLAQADWYGVLTCFLASGIAMKFRQWMVGQKHNPLITFGSTSFVATLMVSAFLQIFPSTTPNSTYVASVLLLVPGFPLTNAVLDLVKGYFVMGVARLGVSSLLTLFIAIGIVAARTLSTYLGWLA